MDKIDLLGGRSLPRLITIYSRQFISQAKYKSSGEIIVYIRRNYFGASMFGAIRFSFLAAIIAVLVLTIVKGAEGMIASGVVWDESSWSASLYLFVSLLMALICARPLIAKWHGAEHKTIAAYEQTGKHNRRLAKRFSPLLADCGGSIVVVVIPMMLLILALLPPTLYWLEALLFIIVLFCPRWFIYWFCGNKMVDFLSRQFQRLFTVSEPGPKELLTAHCALLGLLRAHGREVNLPPEMKLELKK